MRAAPDLAAAGRPLETHVREYPTMTSMERVLEDLSTVLGHPLHWDVDSRCALAFDGGVEILLAVDADEDCLSMSAEITVLPDDAACRAALVLNYGRLPLRLSLAVDAASGRLVVLTRLPLSEATADSVLDLLSELVTLVPLLPLQLTDHSPREPDELARPDLMIRG